MPFWNRAKENNAAFGTVVTELCREWSVPDAPFDVKAAVREVAAGVRPGVPRDGQWWFAAGIEQVGASERTRLLVEDTAPDINAAMGLIEAWFSQFRGKALARPHLPESSWHGRMTDVHRDILYARITGKQRPIGGWAVAVPPHVIGLKR
jgi:hypothetical protein